VRQTITREKLCKTLSYEKDECKIMMKLTHVAKTTNTLRAATSPILFFLKVTNTNSVYRKAADKRLVKLTPLVIFINILAIVFAPISFQQKLPTQYVST